MFKVNIFFSAHKYNQLSQVSSLSTMAACPLTSGQEGRRQGRAQRGEEERVEAGCHPGTVAAAGSQVQQGPVPRSAAGHTDGGS